MSIIQKNTGVEMEIGEMTAEEAAIQTDPGNYAYKCFQEDPSPEQAMCLVEVGGVLDFWDDADEDVYSLDDGEPI